MIRSDSYHEYCRQFNLSRETVGSPLMTLNGSRIRRSKFGVGKPIGGKIYLHKSYYSELPAEARILYELYKDDVPFEFNCIRYFPKGHKLDFIECADFDSAREPTVGRIYSPAGALRGKCSRPYFQIYHHKWTMVDNDYRGFDVKESWEWSIKWLNLLTTSADGSSMSNWKSQLEFYGLK